MNARHAFGLAMLLIASAQVLSAQETKPFTPVLGVQVGSMNIKTETAVLSQVEDRSYGLQLDAGALYKRHLYLGVDLGGQFLKDNAQFTQSTTGGNMKSTADVTYLSAITGLRTGTLRAVPLALGVNTGWSTTMSRRSIDNCSNCHVDKLDIAGGAFVEPTLFFGAGGAKLRVVDRTYLTGDGMRSVISVGVDFQPKKK